MDHKGLRDKDCEIDLESGVVVSEEDSSDGSVSSVKKQAKTLLAKVYGGFSDGSVSAEDRVGFCGNGFNSNGICPENLNMVTNKTLDGNGGVELWIMQRRLDRTKDKRKKTSNKKPSVRVINSSPSVKAISPPQSYHPNQ